MKTIICVSFLAVTWTFVLSGCSDTTTLPVSPSSTSVSADNSLGKTIERDFTFVLEPTGVTDPGITKYPAGKVMVRALRSPVSFIATFSDGSSDLLTGPGEIEVNGLTDFNAGTGQWHGKLTVSPVASEAGGGVWEFTWHGTATLGESGWTLPLKEQGHGMGGALTGLQCTLENVVVAPPDISIWAGGGQGVVYSH